MSVSSLLRELGLTSTQSEELFWRGTRDDPSLAVMRDSVSGVIYLQDHYVGDMVYSSGAYRAEELNNIGSRDVEEEVDTARRVRDYRKYFQGQDIVDFGCGLGNFLRAVRGDVRTCCGIELQLDALKKINEMGIECLDDIDKLSPESIDTVFLFHTLEHLPNPLDVLANVFKVLRPGGKIVVEVPHAGDFLMKHLALEQFIRFTLWSQHLVLHTRGSLEVFLNAVGFQEIYIQGKQRYSLANHLSWLKTGCPGGHKSVLAAIDNADLVASYEHSLQQIDGTDTLVAIARK